MAIDPTTTTTVKVGELASAGYNTTDLIPHEVAGILKKGNLQDLATFIGSIISTEGAVGFRAVQVNDGETLPATTEEEFILVGPGTYPNVGGGATITTTEPLNALVSNGTYWFIGVEIPIEATGVWGTITGVLSDQTDLNDVLDAKADLIDGKVPNSQLPSYVDDVVEVANYAALPSTGETGKIYITIDNNKVYRWSGSTYIEIADNTAVWGVITGTLSDQTDLQNALNAKEGTITAGTTSQYWRGDKSWQTLNKAAVGLGNVDNTSDLNKPISTATQTALNAKFNNPTGDTTQYIAGDGSLISFPISGQAGTIVREVRNTTGATLTKGTIVYINGASGNKPTVTKALATGDSTSAQTFGMLQADLANNSNGYVVCMGDLTGLNTSGISEGAQLYLSSTTAGAYTTTKQLAPAHLVYIGVVTRSHATQGQIEVKIQNGYELDEIHDVAISSVANNEVLVYESSTSLWKNKTIPTILGYTPQAQLNGTGFVKISGTTIYYDNTTYLSGTVAIANGGTGATTAGAARTNLGATTVGANIFTIPNPNPVTKAYIRANADNTVEWLDGNAFRESIGAGTGNGTVTSVNGTGSYGGLTLTGTVTGSGDLTLGGTPTGTWPISVSGNAASVNTVFNTTNADHYITFADANNGSPTSEFLYTIGTVKVNPSTGALTAGSFVKSGGTSSQFLMADGSVSTGSGGTVTSVAAITLGTTGTDLSSTVANGTTTPVITLNVPTASATNRGALSSADWTTFNSKQNALTNPVTGTGTSGQIAYWNGTSSITGESNLFWDATNDRLGIGTASPNGSLSIVAPASSTAISLFGRSSDNYSALRFESNTGATRYATIYTNAADLIFETNTERMRITSDGNVGIGTTVPSNLLSIGVANSTTGKGITIENTSGIVYGRFGVINPTVDNDTYIGSMSNNNFLIYSNATERMRITSGGNVGIGTDSPTKKLHVKGGNDSVLFLDNGGERYTTQYFANNGTTKSFLVWDNTNSLFEIGTAVSSDLRLLTNNAERIRIFSNGNTFIGASPTDAGYKLDVNGTGRFSGNTTISGGNVNTGSKLTLAWNDTDGAFIQSYASKPLLINALGNNVIFNRDGGNVGIGTTSPVGKFHVKNNIQSNSITRANSAAVFEAGDGVLTIGQVVAFGDANNYGMWLQSQKNDDSTGVYFPLNIQPAGGNTIINSASGNVLIGTTTDAGYKLDVNGSLRSSTNSIIAGTFTFINLENNSSKLNCSRFLAIQETGNVGVGYNSDSVPVSAKLAVNGNVYIGGTITATGGFFNSDIRLKNLTDYDYNVSDIKPITYLWKDGRDNKKHVGYSAQQVQKVMPDAVNEDEKGFLSVNYVEVLVAKISQMEKEIAYLKSKI